MTTSVPNSFNPEDLAKMLESAPKEADLGRAVTENSDTTHDFSEETVSNIADEALDYASERSHGPLVHKVMVCKIICNMIEWHSKMHSVILEEGEQHSALCWARDAGKFQAIMDILMTINVGPEDFVTPNE